MSNTDSESPPDSVDSEFEDDLADQFRDQLTAKEPSESEREQMKADHAGHLVRRTTSQVTNTEILTDGVEVNRTAHVPDMYCFTCEGWVGLSGVDLTGRPRSRKEAFYLGGKPESVLTAEQQTRDVLADLTKTIAASVPHVEDVDDALTFIETEVSKAKQRVSKVEKQ